MELTKRQRENIAKTFLDIFKLVIPGVIITDFVFKAAVGLKIFAVVFAIILFLTAIWLDR